VRPAVLALLAGTAVLYLWGLSASEWANSYYSAAAQAGSQSWKAWLLGSSDAANSITVDKTPASLWVMTASVRLFGLSSWSVLAPQALQGVAAVGVLYAAVRRVAGPAGGLLAGAVLALTPVAVLMFRFNNPDALLTLLLVVAAYALVRGLEGAFTRWLVLAAVAVGFGFLTKMLQALVIVPALAAVWLYAAPTSPGRRLGQLVVAAVALMGSAMWYVAMVALWPAHARPYIGGSQSNSIIELTLGYNGFQRLTGEEVGAVGGGPAVVDGGAGWLRLFEGQVGGQIAWLLPAALVLLATGLWARRGRARTDACRASLLLWGGWLLVTAAVFSAMQGIFHGYYTVALAPAVAALIGLGGAECWSQRHHGWAARLALAIAVAATAVWGAVLLGRVPNWLPWLRVAVLVVGGVAALGVGLGLTRRWAGPAVAAGAVATALMAPAAVSLSTAAQPHFGAIPRVSPSLVAGSGTAALPADGGDAAADDGGRRAPDDGGRRTPDDGAPRAHDGVGRAHKGGGRAHDGGGRAATAHGPRGLARASSRGLAASVGDDDPAAWRLPGGGPFGALPANVGVLGGLLSAGEPPEELVELVRADAEDYTWAAAAIGSNQAAGVQLAARVPVMPVGGFNGTDPSPTLAQFRQLVAADEIHYFLSEAAGGRGPAGFGPAQGGSRAASRIRDWVTASFPARTVGGVTVYDLDP
jgi:4-amino-4-deoxy-L-arabinose transferase-like glycosyltransferase